MNAVRGVLRGLSISLLFTALIFGARAIGRTQPPPEALQELHLNDCQLPCWLGIVPGKTTFDEAVQRIIDSDPVIFDIQADENSAGGWYQVGSAVVPVVVVADNNRVIAQIMLITSDVEDLAVGDVANYFGTPSCIDNQVVSVVYSESRAFAIFGYSIADERWRTPLDNIEIYEIADDISLCPLQKTK